MVLKMNQQRFLTIAGSASLVALAAFGIWKWSKHAPEKKTKRKDRQVDKDSKQSHSSVSAEEAIKSAERITTAIKATEKEHVQQQPAAAAELNEPQPSTIQIEEQVIKVEPKVEAKVEQPLEVEEIKVEEIKFEEIKEVESSQELMMETIAVAVEDKQVVAEDKQVVVEDKQEEEEYVMVKKKQESQSCATSSGDETGVWTPEHEPEMKADNTPKNATSTKEYIWKADSYVAPPLTAAAADEEQKSWSAPVTTKPLSSDAAVFVPRRQVQAKKSLRRRLTRPELIQQQRQNYTPHAKARCSHWPCCTNKNCKFWHPFRDCREGETCPFGNKCMFIHPSDYLEPVRGNTTVTQEEEEEEQI
ncbi:hypothetical protein EDC94DRAFT_624462 [Helicostylum pulchrum]|nr:hypothetical protein EDC94DRAFT_624462 [Helicostylum pulchrum]